MNAPPVPDAFAPLGPRPPKLLDRKRTGNELRPLFLPPTVRKRDYPALIARTSAARLSTGMVGNSSLSFFGRARR